MLILMECNKIALLYNDGNNKYIITHRKEDENFENEPRQVKRRVTKSIDKSLKRFFKQVGGEIELEEINNACQDVYILYLYGDKRVIELSDYEFNYIHNKDP